MNIAIAGYGMEGKANYAYWNTGEHTLTIADERDVIDAPEDVDTICGPGAFGKLNGFDMVVRTAGLAPEKIMTDGKIWSSTNEFFEKCPVPIIGVTGTKGKGTTCSLIASILEATGKKVHLVGNIGTPALEVLPNITPDDYVVYEMSSFQLWDIKQSPEIAVCLLIEPDHLNVHPSMEDYVAAKANIARYQNADDVFFFHPKNEYAESIAVQSDAGLKLRYNHADDEGSVYVDTHSFCYRGATICSVDALQIVGDHNRENACAALSVAKYLGIDDVTCEEGLRNFTGLPHRLKRVREVNGVVFFDDSISTTPGSAVAALHSFGSGTTIILGGSDKGSTYDELVSYCKHYEANVVTLGETGQTISTICEQYGVNSVGAVSMDDAVSKAYELARASGNVVVLSPASASFDMFNNYAERGDAFIDAVRQL